MKTIQAIIKETPRASLKNPTIKTDKNDPAKKIITAGSPADAVRIINALRLNGYAANLLNPYEPTKILTY